MSITSFTISYIFNNSNAVVLSSFWLTIWWDLWWRQPRWHSRYQAFWCLHRCPCGSSTSTPRILPEPAGSPQDQLHQHMLELSKTDAEVWRGGKKSARKTEMPSVKVMIKMWFHPEKYVKSFSADCFCKYQKSQTVCVVWECQTSWLSTPERSPDSPSVSTNTCV